MKDNKNHLVDEFYIDTEEANQSSQEFDLNSKEKIQFINL